MPKMDISLSVVVGSLYRLGRGEQRALAELGWMSPTEKEEPMTMIDQDSHVILEGGEPRVIDQAELAAVAFLARYSGRTLEAYRHDLRNVFQ